MTEFSIREVVEMAVQTEKLGFEFYNDMAEKYKKNKELYELFSTLAQQERIHEKRFRELKELIGDKEPEDWNEVADYMRAVIESAFFIGKDKATLHIRNIQDPQAAIGFAVAFEKETLLFYYGLRDAVREKGMVDEIITKEQSHIKWLNDLKNKRERPSG